MSNEQIVFWIDGKENDALLTDSFEHAQELFALTDEEAWESLRQASPNEASYYGTTLRGSIFENSYNQNPLDLI